VASATPIAAATGLSIVTVPGLRERGLGVFEGLTREQAESHYPEQFRDHRSDRLDFAPTGGETLAEHLARTLNAVNTLALRHAGETIALVTHGGSLSMLFRAVLGIPFSTRRAYFVSNTALNVFEHGPSGLTLVSWGDTGHL
jgi:probable phosphoglycerate mutase